MGVRCKFQLTEATTYPSGMRKLVFRPNYDETIPEDQRFAKASPSGQLEIQVDNPVAAQFFEIGAFYYFDAVRAA